jgi:hypothetical protein
MFSVAIRSPPFPFVHKVAVLKAGKISAPPVAKIFAQRFIPKQAVAFIP